MLHATNASELASTASDSEDEHFSDASEGHGDDLLSPESGRSSPVPRTRVERVDDSAQHGEVPGTPAYEQREQDAVPDEIEVVPEGTHSRDRSSAGLQDRPLTPGGSPIPRTMVEKIDLDSPSYGEVPGTEAFEKRQADAVPDFVKKADDLDDAQPLPPANHDSPQTNSSDQSIPETKLSRVKTPPTEAELLSRPRAHHRSSPSDAEPDTVETVSDAPKPEMSLPQVDTERRNEDFGAGDDFDEFVEEQDQMGEDDFGDFDDGFQEPSGETAEGTLTGDGVMPQQPPAPLSVVSTFG